MGAAFMAGGLDVLEITLRTEFAAEAIKTLKREYPEMKVAAGTVLTEQQAGRVADDGADFIVTPGFSPKLIEKLQPSLIPILPGVATASEITWAIELGFEFMKFFPAEASGGVAALKSLRGPFPNISFCPTGGIGKNNMASYLEQPNVRMVGGSWVDAADVRGRERWEEITRRSIEARKIAGSIDGNWVH